MIELSEMVTREVPELATDLPDSAGEFRLGRFRITQGKQAGCELLVVDFGRGRAAICPTRGMSLWKAELDSVACRWQSPVRGPVHPSFVATGEPSGIGWLDGFDEWLVRCGLQSFGAPDFDASGRLTHALHGRIANIPADHWSVESVDSPSGKSTLVVRGEVRETRFLVCNLRLTVEYRFEFGSPTIAIHDRVTNDRGVPASMQLLYHINFGKPLLNDRAQVALPTQQIVARNARAAEGIVDWATYGPPTAGFEEQVFFAQPIANSSGWSHAMLLDSDQARGVVVHFNTDTLPYFSLWKNTVADADGYVTGLEPGTGFPNPHSFEKQHGRVVDLQPGESRDFQLVLEGSSDRQRLAELKQQVALLQGDKPPIQATSWPSWCL